MDRLQISNYSHLAFRVSDLERSRAFYARLFGYDPFIETPLEHRALSQLTGGTSSKAVLVMGLIGDKVLELVQYDGLPPEQLGFSHFGLRVEDVDETYRRALELDAPVLVEPTDIQGVRVMFIEDPDGNRFELGAFEPWPPPRPDGVERAAQISAELVGALSAQDAERILRCATAAPRWQLGERVLEGTDGVRERIRLEASAFAQGSARRELRDVIAGEDRVAARCELRGQTQSGAETSGDCAFFVHLRDGRIDRVHELGSPQTLAGPDRFRAD